ncbi:bifunctional phosphoribosylaminoimidazolecarboxamide formyltransferase/IMP cyclohydrolase [Acidobacteriia bacterium AH_259_A11_L15]|nr:bifunctional phosphoribosylaminoimidazolecarboxamide formyltransferase/IMP cyclohydrolase [Acidobacteriia bacterium AH_259_A11_L15]
MKGVERALVSVYDKRGVVELARALAALEIEILSTGGTARRLRENGVRLREVSEVTGFPEMLGGRVKTLHPAIHAGILARRDDPQQLEQLRQQGLGPIDLVVVNLYPFAQTAARPEGSGGATPAELVEEIDIGGPTMVRAAAKNFQGVGVVVSPDDYERVIEELKAQGGLSLGTRLELARKAFATTAAYDATIASTLEELRVEGSTLTRQPPTGFPAFLRLTGKKVTDLRYGENPHQRAVLYRLADAPAGVPRGGTEAGGFGIAGARQLQGKELSYNNLLDLDAAWDLASEFQEPFGASPQGEPVVAIIKHTNPCGVAVGRPEASGQAEAYEKALACDPVSAFGSVMGLNQPLTAATAEAMSKLFVEAIAAPGYEPKAREILAKKKNLRLMEVTPQSGVILSEPEGRVEGSAFFRYRLRSISGGLLVQEKDCGQLNPKELRTVSKRAPTTEELQSLLFAWVVAKHVKSNAIVYARDGQTVGIGAGQMSRVDSVKLGAMKARELGHAGRLKGSVLASDAFFPFPDGVEEAAKAGVTAVIQPGGSKRDPEVIAAADRLGLTMVFTGIRHFRH